MKNLQEFEEQCHRITKEIKKNAKENNTYRVIDGVIDPKQYFDEECKILWVLKEANAESTNFSFLENFKNEEWLKTYGRKVPTLKRVFYTTYAILENAEWSDIPYSNTELAFPPMQKIAWLNIKKVPGKSSVNDKAIRDAYNKDQDLLRKQIETYDADIIIFGGTFKYFEWADFNGLSNDPDQIIKYQEARQITELGNHFFSIGEKLYISSWHPALREKGMTDYNYVMDIANIVKAWRQK